MNGPALAPVQCATSALEPFTAHWNGTAWATVPVPASGAELEGLAVISHTDVWAVGMGPKGKAVTENWTGGRSWHLGLRPQHQFHRRGEQPDAPQRVRRASWICTGLTDV